MTREQRFAKLEQHVERLLNLGRCFVLTAWEMAGVVEMAQDAEVGVEVKYTNHGYWVVLQ